MLVECEFQILELSLYTRPYMSYIGKKMNELWFKIDFEKSCDKEKCDFFYDKQTLRKGFLSEMV